MLKEIDSDKSKNTVTRSLSTKIFIVLGIILLFFIGKSILLNQAAKMKEQKSPTSKEASGSAEVQGVATQWVVDEVKEKTSGIGKEIVRVGGEVGGAVLGDTVKFFQKNATESAQNIASSAANVVIQSTAPGIVDQINKLPEGQRNELKKLICD